MKFCNVCNVYVFLRFFGGCIFGNRLAECVHNGFIMVSDGSWVASLPNFRTVNVLLGPKTHSEQLFWHILATQRISSSQNSHLTTGTLASAQTLPKGPSFLAMEWYQGHKGSKCWCPAWCTSLGLQSRPLLCLDTLGVAVASCHQNSTCGVWTAPQQSGRRSHMSLPLRVLWCWEVSIKSRFSLNL